MNLKEKLDLLDGIDKMRVGTEMNVPWYAIGIVREKIYSDQRSIPPAPKRYKTKILRDGSLRVQCVSIQNRVVKTAKSGQRIWDGRDQYFFNELYVGHSFQFDSQRVDPEEVKARCADAGYEFRFLRTDKRRWVVCIDGLAKKDKSKFGLSQMKVGESREVLDVGENVNRLSGQISSLRSRKGWSFSITDGENPYVKIYTRTA